jgi:hypothetical protein
MQSIIALIALLSLFNPVPADLPASPPANVTVSALESIYQSIDFGTHEKPDTELFEKGLAGYVQLMESQKISNTKHILTLIDFRKSSNEKRLWTIDLKAKKVVFHSLVSHGRNSGELYARKFSNIANSYQSSLGFYVTGKTYSGKHGLSLKLHGMETGINHLAETRAIVMHGADYVSESYIKNAGRLGRSFGCPAIPMDLYKEMVTELAEGTVLFIYYPDEKYLASSPILSKTPLIESIARAL